MTATFRALAQPFLDAGVLQPAEYHAVALTAARFGEDDPERLLGLAFAVRAPRLGHAAVLLEKVREVVEAERATEADEPPPRLPWPCEGDGQAWTRAVLASPMVGEPDAADRPFVRRSVDAETLLFTRLMYREEERIAEALAHRARALADKPAGLDASIERLFGAGSDDEAASAVRLAAARRLAVIVGGPGTGKTYSVSRLLAALLENEDPARPLSIALGAPTGKAAARMREAIREATDPGARRALHTSPAVIERLRSLEARTLHSLLGVRPDGSVRHQPDNPLPADVVVVDEVSMVDLVNMRRLLEGVREEARLVLLGDSDQLASVEAGCVLSDLVQAPSLRAACVQSFSRSWRFESAPDVGLLAACLQSHPTAHLDLAADPGLRARALDLFMGRVHASAERVRGPESGGVTRVSHLGAPERKGKSARPTTAQLDALARPYLEGMALLDGQGTFVRGYAARLAELLRTPGAITSVAAQLELLRAFDAYRVLATHRRGPLGLESLERELTARVRERLGQQRAKGGFWIGQPVLITENAYALGVVNGDVGLVLPTEREVELVLPGKEPGTVRTLGLGRLPAHEGALAMTVHKSQGSQFERVALVLTDGASPIQTRELVYTGVTRARDQLAWLGDPDDLALALGTVIERKSGLTALVEARLR
jgi:exodeoxyribonuclease V alpha subunit